MNRPFEDHFSAIAARYAEFRPRYPEALFDWLARVAPGHALAWDSGTGSGQAAVGLASRFERVVATDASAEQLAHAEAHPRILYRLARETASGLDDRSCDLVSVAQALHWFDIPAFFAEARRVLVPGGVIAAWTYVEPALEDRGLDGIFQRLAGLLRPSWPRERAIAESGYRQVPFPFTEIAAPTLELEMHPTLEELAGYVRTWSATRRFVASTGTDPVAALERELTPLWPSGSRRRLRFPLFIRAGRA